MNWINFIMWMFFLYLIYYTSIILYDLFIKKDGRKKGEKAKKLIIFEEHSPTIIDKVDVIEEVKKPVERIKEEKSESFSFMDFKGSPDPIKEEEVKGGEEEIGIGGIDLKTLQKRAKLLAKAKLSKVKFEEVIA